MRGEGVGKSLEGRREGRGGKLTAVWGKKVAEKCLSQEFPFELIFCVYQFGEFSIRLCRNLCFWI